MMENPSIMTESSSLNERIAARVRDLRVARKLSLDALSTQCGVSRSMLSLIERGETSPTAVVLDKLAAGLGVPLASLFDPPAPSAPSPVLRRADQVSWQDPHSGYVRRNVSPGGESPTQIVDVVFPPQARVTYEAGARERVLQQVWILEGTMEIAYDGAVHRLAAGDCLAMALDQPNSFHNPGDEAAHYVVVLTTIRN
jgi:transcriptional regulator with XRE-family HTH domain